MIAIADTELDRQIMFIRAEIKKEAKEHESAFWRQVSSHERDYYRDRIAILQSILSTLEKIKKLNEGEVAIWD